jgi:heme/copper-type cytochrome/quinol oxidase subunit 2
MSIHTDSTRPYKFLLPLLIVLAALLVPLTAFAIPGSGDFVAVDSGSGRTITELYNIIAKVCLVILVLVEGLLVVAILKFRRRSDDEQPVQTHGNMKLELGWTLAAVLLQIYLGFITVDVMFDVEVLPEESMTVEAIARQWDWDFRYPDHGGIIHEDLIVPANTNITLEVTSQDVLHAIFIPELGVKIDAVPGRINYYWFNADGPRNTVAASVRPTQEVEREPYATTRPEWWSYLTEDFLTFDSSTFYNPAPGNTLERRVDYLAASRDASTSPYSKYTGTEYRGMCAEMCGRDHWNMYFRTVAMTRSSFEQWLEDKASGANQGEVNGAQLYAKNCVACHGQNGQGTPGTYPPLVGARFTTQEDMKREHVEIVLNGLQGELTVKGVTYNGIMQPFGGRLNDEEVAAVVNHERTSWGNDGGTVDAEFVATVRAELGLPPFPAGGAEPVPDAELMAIGERVYSSCVSCHGQNGTGLEDVPDFAGNVTILSNIEAAVKALDQGLDTPTWPGFQPPMGQAMSDRQVAGVLTYIRKSFGNEASAVQPAEVSRIREQMGN